MCTCLTIKLDFWAYFTGSQSNLELIFQLILFVFKTLTVIAPTYLSELLHSYQPDRSLRSSRQSFPWVPRSRSKLRVDRAFSVAGPKLCKSLPQHIRSAPSLDFFFFKSILKTHSFLLAFEPTDPKVDLVYILIYFYSTLAVSPCLLFPVIFYHFLFTSLIFFSC